MSNTNVDLQDLGKPRLNGDLHVWDVEDENFWERQGKKVATRNLWISISSLLMGFAVCLVINWWFYLRPNAYVKNP